MEEMLQRIIQRIEGVEASNRRVVAMLVRIEARLGETATKFDLAQLESRVNQRIDGVAGQIDDLRFRYAIHSDTLMTHDKRLKKLEGRR